MRGSLPCAIAAAGLAGCSLLVSVGDLQTGSVPSDAGAADANPLDAALDAAPLPDASTGTYRDEVLSDSPITYYRLDDTGKIMADFASSHLDGTYGPATVVGAPGLLGPSTVDTAANFIGPDGGGSIVGASVPRSPKLEVTSAISIEAWIRITKLSDAEIVSYGPQTGPPYQPWSLQYGHNTDGSYQMQLFGAGLGFLIGQTNLVTDTTYYFVGTFDGATLRIYLNAQVDGLLHANGTALSNYDHVTGLGIGSGPLGDNPVFAVVDEVAIYDRALTADRITAHYAAGTK